LIGRGLTRRIWVAGRRLLIPTAADPYDIIRHLTLAQLRPHEPITHQRDGLFSNYAIWRIVSPTIAFSERGQLWEYMCLSALSSAMPSCQHPQEVVSDNEPAVLLNATRVMALIAGDLLGQPRTHCAAHSLRDLCASTASLWAAPPCVGGWRLRRSHLGAVCS
jgi:hypothetical protein